MNRNVIETVLGAVVLVVAAIFVIFALGSTDGGKSKDGYIVKADFNRIDGLKVGTDVRMNGVLVGTVRAIDLNKNSYRATVSFTVDPEIKLPRDTNASIANESLLGGKYLSLDIGVEDDMVATDGTGRLTRTTPPMRLDDLIGQLIYKEEPKKQPGAIPPPPPGAAAPMAPPPPAAFENGSSRE